MWATKVSNNMKEQDTGNKRLELVCHKEVWMDSFSRTRVISNRGQSDPTVLVTTESGSINMLNDQMEKLTKTVEQIAGHVTTLRSDVTTWKSDMTIWKKMMDEDMKTIKLDIKTS